ncbi:MAG: hypothetical protein KDB03_13925 [Planctomycetales bacterium]|nr:hypothetical protein [Planctomycetales bacterium]
MLTLAWHDNGQMVATGGADNALKIWKAMTGEQQRTITGFNKEVTAVQFVGSTSQLVAVSADASARLVNADDGKVVRSFAGADTALYCLGIVDGKYLSASGQSGHVWTWNIEDGKLQSDH